MTDSGRYFDHAAATTPNQDALTASMEAARLFYGNPSARHPSGETARRELQRNKQRISELMGFSEGRIVLTSGGTESNNLVINHYLTQCPDKKIAIAVNAHASMWFPSDQCPKRVLPIPLSESGLLDTDSVTALSEDDISLCCVNHVCNEIGVVQDIRNIAEICLRRNIPLLVDGVQAIGKVTLDVDSLECDYYSFSAHKFGGPHGVGGIFCRGAALQPMIRGGGQEWGMRSGTENLSGLCGTTVALEQRLARLQEQSKQFQRLAEKLIGELEAEDIAFLVNSRQDDFLTGILSLSFPGWKSQIIASELTLSGFSVATGSACHSDKDEPSRTILSLGRSAEEALGTVRISFGPGTTADNVVELARAMKFLKP